MSDVPMRLVDALFDDKHPGDAKYFSGTADEASGLNFVCPCGCSRVYGINKTIWTWTGTREAPTVRDSIQCNPCGWHGWLTDGVFSKQLKTPKQNQN